MTLAERFWAKVAKAGDDECWLWTAAKFATGYGGIGSGASKTLYAHRVSYEINCGPIPDGKFVLHRCDVRACVNPAHLFVGESVDNVRDMLSKGRGSGKLTPAQVAEIRQMLGSVKQRAIAKMFGVSQSAVMRISTKRGWLGR